MIFALIAVVAGIYTFIVIPSIKKDMQRNFDLQLSSIENSYRSVLVYCGKTPLLKGSVITEYNKRNFEIKKIPKEAVTFNAISDFTDILGCEVEYTICKGQQVSYENFTEFLKIDEGNERLKEFKISGLVAEHAQVGSFVDMIVSYETGYDVVVPKVQLYDIVFDQETNSYKQDKNGMFTVVIAVNEEEYRDLMSASQIGTLDIRVYLNDEQTASEKTFFYTGF